MLKFCESPDRKTFVFGLELTQIKTEMASCKGVGHHHQLAQFQDTGKKEE